MRRVVLCFLSCALAGPVFAGDAPPAAPAATPNPTPTQVAGQAALDAFTAKDTAALAALAARNDPDPWLVAEDLLRRGAAEAAEAFAAAAPRIDVEALPAYVAARRTAGDDTARRTRVATAQAAMSAGKLEAALEALGPAEAPPPRDVPGVQLQQLRGLVLARQQRLGDAAVAMAGAAETAEALGWLARARPAPTSPRASRSTAATSRARPPRSSGSTPSPRGAATVVRSRSHSRGSGSPRPNAATRRRRSRPANARSRPGRPPASPGPSRPRAELGARLVRFGGPSSAP